MSRLILFFSLFILLIPHNTINAQDDCSSENYLETRLFGGEYARVTLGGSANRVRAEPSTDGAELFQIPPGHIFSLNYTSTVCSEGIVWREVTYIDQVGWTAESYLAVSPDYFIEPLDSVQTIDETIRLDNGATAVSFTPDGTQVTMALADGNLRWFNLLDDSEGQITLNTDLPILSIVYHPDGSGVYATIHAESVNIWNSNHNLIRQIESRMLADYPAVFEMDDDWGFLANGGCLETDNGDCVAGAIILINPDTDSEIVSLDNHYTEAVRDIDFMSRVFTTPGDSTYSAIMTSIGAQSRLNASLRLREGANWQQNNIISSASTLNTVATTLEYGVTFYGGCMTYDDEVCTQGYLEATSWMSGGTHSNFDSLPAEVLDVQFSNSHQPNLMRIVALTSDAAVSVLDFSHQNFEIETVITVFDDIPTQAFSISPDGSVLAVASNDTVMLYDISIDAD